MISKNGTAGIQCIYCDNLATEDSDPPVCKEHLHLAKVAGESATLKQLEHDSSIWEH